MTRLEDLGPVQTTFTSGRHRATYHADGITVTDGAGTRAVRWDEIACVRVKPPTYTLYLTDGTTLRLRGFNTPRRLGENVCDHVGNPLGQVDQEDLLVPLPYPRDVPNGRLTLRRPEAPLRDDGRGCLKCGNKTYHDASEWWTGARRCVSCGVMYWPRHSVMAITSITALTLVPVVAGVVFYFQVGPFYGAMWALNGLLLPACYYGFFSPLGSTIADEAALDVSRRELFSPMLILRDSARPITRMLRYAENPVPAKKYPAAARAMQYAEARVAAAVTLARLGQKAAPAVGELTKALSNDNARVRAYAAFALAEIGAPAANAVPRLQRLSELDPNPGVREIASSALARLNGP